MLDFWNKLRVFLVEIEFFFLCELVSFRFLKKISFKDKNKYFLRFKK